CRDRRKDGDHRAGDPPRGSYSGLRTPEPPGAPARRAGANWRNGEMLKISMVSALMAAATGSAAYAQTIVLEPEDEIIVREYVLTQPRRHVVIPEGYEVVIGERLPDTIV